MIKALIIDDEDSAVNVVKLLLNKYVPEIDSITTAVGSREGWLAIQNFKPDLVFLDIEMPMMSGFELLEKFPDYAFDVIFITAYDHYAIKAIRFSALDYLLKPIDADELRTAVQRFLARKTFSAEKKSTTNDHKAQYDNLLHNLKTEQPNDYRLAISTTVGTYFYQTDEIIRCEADGNYTKFFLINKKPVIASKTLKEFDEILSGQQFIRVHRAHLVNKKYIRSLTNDHELHLSDDSSVEVSRRRWEEVKRILQH
ncbi:MAG: LytTR family DNA-binding domain-containing protein [Chitinophagales bacterium]